MHAVLSVDICIYIYLSRYTYNMMSRASCFVAGSGASKGIPS